MEWTTWSRRCRKDLSRAVPRPGGSPPQALRSGRRIRRRRPFLCPASRAPGVSPAKSSTSGGVRPPAIAPASELLGLSDRRCLEAGRGAIATGGLCGDPGGAWEGRWFARARARRSRTKSCEVSGWGSRAAGGMGVWGFGARYRRSWVCRARFTVASARGCRRSDDLEGVRVIGWPVDGCGGFLMRNSIPRPLGVVGGWDSDQDENAPRAPPI